MSRYYVHEFWDGESEDNTLTEAWEVEVATEEQIVDGEPVTVDVGQVQRVELDISSGSVQYDEDGRGIPLEDGRVEALS